MERDITPLLIWLNNNLPDDYSKFISLLSESVIMNEFVLLYSIDDIIERNETFEVKKYCPEYLSIADDSGGNSIMLSITNGHIGIVDQGSMMPQDIRNLASSFTEWKDSDFSIE